MPPLVRRADDEHTHVLPAGRIKSWAVGLVDVVPVQVHVIKGTRFDCSCDQIRGAMGGETNVANAASLLPPSNHIHATARAQSLINVARQVDAMDRQKIKPIATQPLKRELELLFEFGGVLPGWNLALQDALRIRNRWQSPAQLPL